MLRGCDSWVTFDGSCFERRTQLREKRIRKVAEQTHRGHNRWRGQCLRLRWRFGVAASRRRRNRPDSRRLQCSTWNIDVADSSDRLRAMATHQFKPTHYHTTLGPHEPVLRIASGDTVVTTTVDAMGCDSTGNQITEPGNPQTGPFYIEGAAAGDALAVHFDLVRVNRDTGWSSTVIAPNVIEPWYARELPKWERGHWRIDREARTATLLKPQTSLGEFTIPIVPMLGCFGVAPDEGQAISTATSG